MLSFVAALGRGCIYSSVNPPPKKKNSGSTPGRVIIDCIQFPSFMFGTFPTSMFGTFPTLKFGTFPI